MPSQKYLSRKKTAIQSISLSPALKEWLQRYVRVKHHETPDDIRFKSVSSFISSLIMRELSQGGK